MTDATVDQLDVAEQVRHFEVEGYLVLPGVLDAGMVETLKAELESLPMRPSFYSDDPMFADEFPHWHGPALQGLIAHEPTVRFVEALMGPDLVFMHSHFIQSWPGTPSLELHSDYNPYGSVYSKWKETCPVRVRVLYYLDDTRTDRSALRIVPRSHISFHADANPYRRYRSHAEEIVVPLRAGDAFVFAPRLFHGTTANTTDERRGMLEYDYRPLWSRPVQPVADWPTERVAAAAPEVQRFLGPVNSFDEPWEFTPKIPTVEASAPGLAPSRWS